MIFYLSTTGASSRSSSTIILEILKNLELSLICFFLLLMYRNILYCRDINAFAFFLSVDGT